MFESVKVILSDAEHRHTVINTLVSIFMRVMGAVTSLIFNIIIARQLGPEQAGYFFLSFAIAMLLAIIACLGFENTVLRYTSASIDQGNQVKKILNFALKYVIPASSFFAIVLFCSASFIADSLFDKILLDQSLKYISPSIIGLSTVSILAMSLQARHKLFASIPCQNMGHFLLCGAAVLVLNVTSANSVALYLSLSLGLTSSFFYWLAIRNLNQLGDDIKPALLWESATPNWITVLMSQGVQWSVPIFIGIYLAAEQVAYFSVAQRIALLTSFVLIAVNLVVAPKFSALKAKNDINGIRKTSILSVRLLLLSSTPIIVFMLLLPEFLMGLFGQQFKQGAPILQILVLGQAVNVITGSVGFLLMMSGNERDMRFVAIISGFSMLICIPIFTKLYGVYGAACVTSFCISMQCLLAVYFVKKRLGFNTLRFWQKI